MIEATKYNEDTVTCERLFSTFVTSNPFNSNFLTQITYSPSAMESIDDQSHFFPNKVDDSEVSVSFENSSKKGNFRQRIRSLREECDDGPLLASAEDFTETDDDSGFVVAHRSKRGRRTKEFVPKDISNSNPELDTSSPNQSTTETDSNVSSDQSCTQNVLNRMTEHCADMNQLELDTLFHTEEKQDSNFKDFSNEETGKKLDELEKKQDGNYENAEKLPSKPAWVEVKPTSQNRVLDFNECTVCFGAWDSDEKIILQECGHCFHSECLRNWMKMKSTCPFCSTYSLSPDDFPKLT